MLKLLGNSYVEKLQLSMEREGGFVAMGLLIFECFKNTSQIRRSLELMTLSGYCAGIRSGANLGLLHWFGLLLVLYLFRHSVVLHALSKVKKKPHSNKMVKGNQVLALGNQLQFY